MDSTPLCLFASGVLGFGVRAYLGRYLEKKAENLATKEDVAEITGLIESAKLGYASQLEMLKSELEHSVNVQRFQYETELQIYRDIWAALIDIQSTAESLRPALDTLPKDDADRLERDQSRLNALAEAYQRFSAVVHKNRPFYPHTVYDSLLRLRSLAGREAIEFRHERDRPSLQYWESAMKNAKEISQQVDSICEVLRERLRSSSGT